MYGLRNSGFYGIPVKAQNYDVSFRVRADKPSTVQFYAGLYNKDSSTTFARIAKSVAVTTTWQEVTMTISNTMASSALDNLFGLDVDAGSPDVQLNFISVFPPTWQGTTARPDLAQAIADLKPIWFRLPGGNDLEGNDLTQYQKWNTTVGDVTTRPGRLGTWAGWNTEGYGLNEAYDIFTKMGASPILGIFAGYALNQDSVPKSQLGPYVTDALNEIHYLTDAQGSSDLAKKRATDGHPTPWDLDVIQIGNEDWISAPSVKTYSYRYPAFHDPLAKAFPQKLLMSSSPYSVPKNQLKAIDQHDYNTPKNLIGRYNERDSWPRNGTTVWELEFSVINSGLCGEADSTDLYNNDCRLTTPTQAGAIAEATFMMGLEKNGDITPSAAYAPLFKNNGASQWSPDLIEFNVLNTVLSPSYYVQYAFGNNRISDIHTVTSSSPAGPVYWSVGTTGSTYIVKLSNVASTSQSVVVKLDKGTFKSSGSFWQITSKDPQATNTISKPNTIKPTTRALTAQDFVNGALQLTLPPNSFVVAVI